ncbi:putative enzyme [Desulfosarcina cetonica]|uniref:SDR family NAD(P)-dependent oxidoreductase n=1 Tax=Desulfosarcina cetonica TaxID=90730 RepID=UPI0006D0C226|nr:SDR family NAD(P)-dependent oxidoreductase [Desulfosarcina cetonica]VTR67026.1 putative enzyme [Desulfosarcina cetonica]
MQIENCVAAVTGGASGLGEATVRNLVTAGAKTAILDMDEEHGQSLASELGDAVRFFKTDVSEEKSVQQAMDGVTTSFGALHIIVNCAGVAPPMKVIGKKGPLLISKFERVIQINLIGTMNVVRLGAEKMLKNPPADDGERGVVINTASVAAFEGQIGQAAYAASKAAVVGMTLPVAREFADYGIRVMTIAPGLFETPMLAGLPDPAKAALSRMMPFPKRLGRPREYAMLVRQIIENPMLNGETIRLDAAVRLAAK